MTSYRQILKSTSMIGGSSLINIAIKMVRTKFVAVLLGPSGMGLMSVYLTITGMAGTFSGMGVRISAVRRIAEAQGAGDEDRLAATVKTLRRTVLVTGLFGMALMVSGSRLLSSISFGNADHVLAIAVLGVTVLIANVTTGRSCLLQGTRRIGDLAKASVIGALIGTATSIPCYYFWGLSGIVPSLVLLSASSLIIFQWYARRIKIRPLVMTGKEIGKEASSLIRSGAPFMLSALLTALSAYLIRILLIREFGLEGVGLWEAAFLLSVVLVNFVLSAMGMDYFPRLSAVAHDTGQIAESVNTQTEIALLLAVPGLMATIIFAPLAITVFYSGEFDAAVNILRWSIYGVFGRVISWPLGFVMLARGMGKTYFCSEALANVFYVAAVWVCMKLWALPGTGVAFMLLYVVNTTVVYIIGYAVARVKWSRLNLTLISVFGVALAGAGLISSLVDNPWYQYAINLMLLVSISGYCLRRLVRKSGTGWNELLKKASPKRQESG